MKRVQLSCGGQGLACDGCCLPALLASAPLKLGAGTCAASTPSQASPCTFASCQPETSTIRPRRLLLRSLAPVQDNIRGVLGLMKANHPADCMNCDAAGRCEFQASERWCAAIAAAAAPACAAASVHNCQHRPTAAAAAAAVAPPPAAADARAARPAALQPTFIVAPPPTARPPAHRHAPNRTLFRGTT